MANGAARGGNGGVGGRVPAWDGWKCGNWGHFVGSSSVSSGLRGRGWAGHFSSDGTRVHQGVTPAWERVRLVCKKNPMASRLLKAAEYDAALF
jgi:hypothetical protein